LAGAAGLALSARFALGAGSSLISGKISAEKAEDSSKPEISGRAAVILRRGGLSPGANLGLLDWRRRGEPCEFWPNEANSRFAGGSSGR